MRSRRKYDKQFKIDAVELLKHSGKTITAIAEDLGVHPNVLSRWKREYLQKDKVAFPGQGNPRDEEFTRLKNENAELRMEREILKKALAIFSTPEKRNIIS